MSLTFLKIDVVLIFLHVAGSCVLLTSDDVTTVIQVTTDGHLLDSRLRITHCLLCFPYLMHKFIQNTCTWTEK